MANKILLLFLVFITAVNARIAVVHSRVSDLPYAEKMVVRLNNYAECKRYAIEGRDGLLKVLMENPGIELLVMLSTVTAEDYAKIVRDGKIRIPPHFTIPDEPIREEELSILLKNGVVSMPVVDPALAIRGLSNRFGSNILSVGYIYGDNFKTAAANESAQLRAADIPVFDRRLRSPQILSDEFAYGIGKFYTSNVYVYRFLGKDPLFTFLLNEPSMVMFVEKRATALIVDTPDYKNIFVNTPVLHLRRNDALLERTASLIILSMLEEVNKKPRFTRPIIIRATSATLLTPEKPYEENIIVGSDMLIVQTERIFQQIGQKDESNGANLWDLCLSSLNSVIDTAISSDKSPNIIHSQNKMWEFISQLLGTPIFGYIACGVLFLMFLFKMVETHQKKRYQRRIALLMPGSINKISLTGSDGNVVSLKILLENEGYNTKPTSSMKGFRKIMRKSFPNVVVADWDAARVMLQLFYQEFTNTHKFSQVGIILINIPINKQTQIKKLFGGASVYCYDDIPTLDDVQSHLRGGGDKNFSQYSEGSYMSGVIHEDNLTAVLQMIEGNMYTGCLVVEEDKPISVIYFKNGRVVSAVDKSGEGGVKSIYNALNCRRGNFYFHLNRSAQNESLNLGTMEILMGWAEQRDRFTKKVQAIKDEK
ncbi:MAG: DUF4388 domain-containing protein [Chitinivibrionia bacterium]|nr:DUF4388 domain-containing protein [Chitinivibrionia bacterium]